MRFLKHLSVHVILLISITVGLASCDDDYVQSKYEDCTDRDYHLCETEKPFYGSLFVDVSLDAEFSPICIEIFRGTIEEGVLEFRDTLRQSSKKYYFETEQYFSAKAYYVNQSPQAITVDGGK